MEQDAKHASSERGMAVGSLGEIIVGLKGGVTQFTQVSFPGDLLRQSANIFLAFARGHLSYTAG